MNRTKQEEARVLRDMGLLSDERDREISRQARSRAYPLLLTASQVLAAACLLQGNPAWAALLSLTFGGWAVQNFSRFQGDGTKLFLALGLLSGGAALGLAGWYLVQGQGEGGFSLGRLAAFGNKACLQIDLSAGVVLALILHMLIVKRKQGRMDGDRWERYFQSISTLGLLARLGGLMAAAMVLVSIVSVPLFQALGFPAPERLALVVLTAGLARLLSRFQRRRDRLLRLLLRLKPAQ